MDLKISLNASLMEATDRNLKDKNALKIFISHLQIQLAVLNL
jgi:hypothetical protein